MTYVPIGNIIADRFTKALSAGKWAAFIKQLGLIDIKARILDRKQKEIT